MSFTAKNGAKLWCGSAQNLIIEQKSHFEDLWIGTGYVESSKIYTIRLNRLKYGSNLI